MGNLKRDALGRYSTAATSVDLEVRFWSKVDKRGESECWPWLACRGHFGHGEFKVGNRIAQAHRIAWVLSYGSIGADVVVRHKCDNPPCCNPSHMEVGTLVDNVRDRDARGRTARGEKSGSAKLTAAQVLQIRKSTESHRVTAHKFGITHTTVRSIRTRHTWAHLED